MRWSKGRLIKGFNDSVIPDDGTIKIIDAGAFMFQTELQFTEIPEGVEIIDDEAFYNTRLAEISLPSTLIKLGSQAFRGCALTKITIPENVSVIESGVFITNPIEEIEVNSNNSTYYSVNNCIIQKSNKCLIQGCLNSRIPSDGSVEILGQHCFSGMDITSLTIPASVKVIHGLVTFFCSYLETITVDSNNQTFHSSGNCVINTANKELVLGCKNSVIPDDGSVTTIATYAFYYCSNLKSIVIPAIIKQIGTHAFTGTSLTSATFEITSGWYVVASFGLQNGTNLSSIGLSNTSTAATYLKSTYNAQYWKLS